MKLNFGKISTAMIIIYIICMIFTVYTLVQLPDTLIYKNQVLDISELPAAQPAFNHLYLVAGITLLIGLLAIALASGKGTEEIVYVEKKLNHDSETERTSDTKEEDFNTLDMNAIKTILAKENDEVKLSKEVLTEVCKQMEAGMGAFYKVTKEKESRILTLQASYALSLGESQTLSFEFGEGLVGQTATEKKALIIDDIPEGYIKIVSGLGKSTPDRLLIVPVQHKNKLYGVAEMAFFTKPGKTEKKMVEGVFNQFAQTLSILESEASKTYPLKGKTEDKKSNKKV